MAQSFLVNSAFRLHPVEFCIGQAVGVVRTYVIQNNFEMIEEDHLRRIQTIYSNFFFS
jgi:hypothetical protein